MMVYIHECVWFVFYYSCYFTISYLTSSVALVSDVNYIILIGSFFLIYWKVYGLDRRISVVVLLQFVYDSLWFAVGFPVTYSSDPRISALYNIPQWTNVLWVNQIEVFGWFLMLVTMILWLTLSRGKPSDTSGIVQA
jgi:hypothetical protein